MAKDRFFRVFMEYMVIRKKQGIFSFQNLKQVMYKTHREIKEERKSGTICGEIRIALKGLIAPLPC